MGFLQMKGRGGRGCRWGGGGGGGVASVPAWWVSRRPESSLTGKYLWDGNEALLRGALNTRVRTGTYYGKQ